jgi:hypothetical protein
MRKRTYNWLHLPSGARRESKFAPLSLSDSQAIRIFNQWNSRPGNVWLYWI